LTYVKSTEQSFFNPSRIVALVNRQPDDFGDAAVVEPVAVYAQLARDFGRRQARGFRTLDNFVSLHGNGSDSGPVNEPARLPKQPGREQQWLGLV
jgi:hypothetical protein